MYRHLLLGSVLTFAFVAALGCAGGRGSDDDDDDDEEADADTDADTDADSDADSDADTDSDTDSDTDADTDSDTDADVDTGRGDLSIMGSITTNRGSFTSAEAGFGLLGWREGEMVCTILGELAYEGTAPSGCPDCEWAFDLGPIADSTVSGPYCDVGSGTLFEDGAVDDYFDFSWGFATAYNYYDSEDNLYPLEETVFVNNGEDGWNMFMFNWPDGGFAQVSGSASNVEFGRIITDSSGNPAYYYFYYR